LGIGVIRLECADCGSDRCAIAGEEEDSSWVVCQDCGSKLITLGELRDEIARQARDYATKSIRESFGRVPTPGAQA
jgi:DNA-directed RNA polymerase subunit RPC12/RpoP